MYPVKTLDSFKEIVNFTCLYLSHRCHRKLANLKRRDQTTCPFIVQLLFYLFFLQYVELIAVLALWGKTTGLFPCFRPAPHLLLSIRLSCEETNQSVTRIRPQGKVTESPSRSGSGWSFWSHLDLFILWVTHSVTERKSMVLWVNDMSWYQCKEIIFLLQVSRSRCNKSLFDFG